MPVDQITQGHRVLVGGFVCFFLIAAGHHWYAAGRNDHVRMAKKHDGSAGNGKPNSSAGSSPRTHTRHADIAHGLLLAPKAIDGEGMLCWWCNFFERSMHALILSARGSVNCVNCACVAGTRVYAFTWPRLSPARSQQSQALVDKGHSVSMYSFINAHLVHMYIHKVVSCIRNSHSYQ